jgi:hypothetical protein
MINRDLKSLTSLWCHLANHQRYRTYVDKKDIKTFRVRAEKEGLAFLTTTLPKIGKALDGFFATGNWTEPDGWQTDRKLYILSECCDSRDVCDHTGTIPGLPIFLGSAIKAAIGGDSYAVECVRQLTLIFYKYEVDHDDSVVEKFLASFCEIDANLPSLEVNEGNKHSLGTLLASMRRLIAEVLCNADPRLIRPCHGGGSTACHTPNKDKWRKFRYIEKLDAVYPYDSHFFFSPTHLIDEYDILAGSEVTVSPHARVCLVPKDSRGPRIISCEPVENMYIQQGLMGLLYDVIETHYLTSGHINFSDQKINRELACQGSITGEYATIDLSEASDRVSLKLVELVFPPAWVECFAACRSEATDLPNGKVVRLNKFAPMGSACCFPVEALVFWACAEAISADVLASLGKVNPSKITRSVYVYGDDIIIPTKYFGRVIDGLESLGLIANRTKSYSAGPFRESCGGDFHLGVDVTPVRVRKALSSDGTGIVTNADLANLFIAKFGGETVMELLDEIEDSVGYHYPRTLLPIPGTIRLVPSASNDVLFPRRWNKNHQRFEYRILCQSMDVKTYHPADWWELLRKELSKDSPASRRDNLTHLRTEEDEAERYGERVKILNSKLDPGQYADLHSARMKWSWTWLGEPRGAGSDSVTP